MNTTVKVALRKRGLKMPWGDVTSPPPIRFNFDNAPPALSF
jgi:hypothetical protein